MLPTFKLGPVDPATPLVINFPFIQAGVYTFWVSSDSTCALGSKLVAGGAPVQATATRVGPSGKAGADDISFLPNNGDQNIAPNRQYPMQGEQLCIMSGDGAQVTAAVKVGQDLRLYGASANDIVVTPFAGQNGCFDVPWIVTGYYGASISRSPAATSFVGFCSTAFPPNGTTIVTPGSTATTITPPPNPVGSPPVGGSGYYHCAKIAYQYTAGGVTKLTTGSGIVSRGTVVTGAAMTGADDHAIQTCFYSATPTGGSTGVVNQYGNQAQRFNGSGAVNLTPLTLDLPTGTDTLLATFDVNNPDTNGGVGGTVKACPPVTAEFLNGHVITSPRFADTPTPNMNLLDRQVFSIRV